MQYKIKRIIGILFIFGMLYLPFLSRAEIGSIDGGINIETIPENPEPYQNVTIKISSYATDLNKAMIEWRSDGNLVLSGIGKTGYSFRTLGPNSTSTFDIQITPIGSLENIIERVVVVPSEIELLWESVDGYTPPFYRGKSFIPIEGTIRVVAIPNTNTIKSGRGNIVYTWKNQDNTQTNASGYNKDSYTFKNDAINSVEKITVVASSVSGNYGAKKTINIPTTSPKIIFYKKSSTEGVLYNKALEGEINMNEDEMTIVAEPYFLSFNNKENNSYYYEWKINDVAIETPYKKTELTIRPTSRGGYAIISVMIENMNELFQRVNKQLKINL